ncbi:uncharacterized protein BJX67DRAFT_359498 [Aspergillus lucknowensis]|uniref:Uncharacterized protein n=1 Tax=Aspergillus lucknowensis TaxID=176173 RepID=A0ABR4LK94_9EURO
MALAALQDIAIKYRVGPYWSILKKEENQNQPEHSGVQVEGPLFKGAEVAFDHLVVYILRIYPERLTWDEFIQIPTASCIVEMAGWNWVKLRGIANSVKQGQNWRATEEALDSLKKESQASLKKSVKFAAKECDG